MQKRAKLEQITREQIKLSRQHYLKLKLPETFRHLEANGIEKDFTMGYYYDYGFRAGTCNSFLFFDLIKNESTNLRLYPFAFMEGTLNDVLKMDIEEAKRTVSALIETVGNTMAFSYHSGTTPLYAMRMRGRAGKQCSNICWMSSKKIILKIYLK